ncbi:MAG: hypothetical protein AB8F74_11310 [Saprospiraceae bacterium]
MDNFLKRYKTRLKLAATQQLEETIKKVFKMIKDDSTHKNTAIIIQARYQNLEQDSMRDIIAEPDRVLRTNQITNNLFELIDNLEVTDLQESDDLLLNGYLKRVGENVGEVDRVDRGEEGDKGRQVEGGLSLDRSGADASSGKEMDSIESNDEEGVIAEVSPKSSKDLEYFSELNRKDLSFFPVIYRDIRSRVFKGESANLELGEIIHKVEQRLPSFQKFRNIMDQLEPILKRIRVDHDKRALWIKFQDFNNRRTSLTMENISNIKQLNEELNAFVVMLEAHGIIKKEK